MTNQENQIASIKAALEAMKFEGIRNEALQDCLGAIEFGVANLEQHLDNWLWTTENAPEPEGEALKYVIDLGRIEEELVVKSLIYND